MLWIYVNVGNFKGRCDVKPHPAFLPFGMLWLRGMDYGYCRPTTKKAFKERAYLWWSFCTLHFLIRMPGESYRRRLRFYCCCFGRVCMTSFERWLSPLCVDFQETVLCTFQNIWNSGTSIWLWGTERERERGGGEGLKHRRFGAAGTAQR